MQKVLAIVGSRDFKNLPLIDGVIAQLDASTIVVSGGARGVDSYAVRKAEARGLQTIEIPADWDLYGRRAGMLRNEDLIEIADGCIAFWDKKSRGTAHAIKLAKAKGIWVRIYREDGTYSFEEEKL